MFHLLKRVAGFVLIAMMLFLTGCKDKNTAQDLLVFESCKNGYIRAVTEFKPKGITHESAYLLSTQACYKLIKKLRKKRENVN